MKEGIKCMTHVIKSACVDTSSFAAVFTVSSIVSARHVMVEAWKLSSCSRLKARVP